MNNIIIESLNKARRKINKFKFEVESYKWAKILERFHNIHKGEDCFILGNGPSLKTVNLNLLKDYFTFATNKIYLAFDSTDWRPTYYVCMDPAVIKQSLDIYKTLEIPKFISLPGLRSIGVNYIFQNTYLFRADYHFEFARCFGRFGTGHTVTYAAIQLAYCMGFKNVFLIGVDHRYKTYEGDKYDMNKSASENAPILKSDDIDHFHPDYFKNHVFPKPNLDASEIAYRISKFFFEADGRKIYDATHNGALTVFEKIDFSTALSMCKKKP